MSKRRIEDTNVNGYNETIDLFAKLGLDNECIDPMVESNDFYFSRAEVENAGRLLKKIIIWNDQNNNDEIKRMYNIAHQWRNAHLYPMIKIRAEMIGKIRKLKLLGLTAARLKQMGSIKNKVNKLSTKLNQINDIAGCRVILSSMDEVNKFINHIQLNSKYPIKKEYDYLIKPKNSGYRSYHVVFNYCDKISTNINMRRVELQIRSRLQHAWATTVEAVGLYRGENLKDLTGNKDWLLFFQLLSDEFARAENMPTRENSLSVKENKEAIIELNRKLNALNILDNLNFAYKYSDEYVHDKANYFLIVYNTDLQNVYVRGFSDHTMASLVLENEDNNNSNNHVVLVKAEKIEKLIQLYPNYYGDVQYFVQNVRHIIKGKSAQEYILPLQATAPQPQRETQKLAWYRRSSKQRHKYS